MVRFAVVRRAILADRSHQERAAWSIFAVVTPTVVRLGIDGGANGVPFVTYFPAVLIASLLLGWQYAALSAIASAVVAERLFIHRRGLLEAQTPELILAGMFFLSCALLIATGEALRRTLRENQQHSEIETTLTNEMRHRIRNIFTVVQATAALTIRSSGTDKFFDAFSGRIAALARANDVLSLGITEPCDVATFIDKAIEPFLSEGNIVREGPAASLAEECCVPTALAFHELCTNSLKYGALSAPNGRVSITWVWTETHLLRFVWKETGGPPVAQPTKQGAGSRLLKSQRALGDVQISYDVDGVECQMQISGIRT